MATVPAKQPSKRPSRPVESIKRTPRVGNATAPAPVAAQSSPTAEAVSSPAKQKQSGSNTLKIVVIVVAVLLGLSIIGGLAASFLARGVVEGGLGSLTGTKAKLDSKSGAVTLQGDGGKSTVSTGKELPAGFPDSVPVYQPSTIKFSASLSKGSYSVTFSTNDNTADVTKYYEKELAKNGWQLKENGQVSFGTVTTSTYVKGTSDLVVVIAGGGGDSSATSVSLSYREDTNK